MSGLPGFNFRAFFEAEARLLAAGHEVENPASNDLPQGLDTPWEICLRIALRQLLLCDGLAVLPGWELSRGASLEVNLAHDLRMPVRAVAGWQRPANRTDATVVGARE